MICVQEAVERFNGIERFAHWLTARSARTFRYPVVFYPICIAIVWIPTVLLGVMGRIQFPGLVGPASNSVLVQMIQLSSNYRLN